MNDRNDSKILCPLINDFIEDVDCMENQVLRDESIDEKFKQKENWRNICKNCGYQYY